jgi:Mn2+/Fe2+ NRAMP family transporter
MKIKELLKTIGPGLLIAATGVGAGDLAGGAFAGSKLGTTVLWAVVLGAFLKYVITEGLTRYQLSTEETLLEGLFSKYGKPVEIFFLIYLVIWSFMVGSALISASGVAGHALFPVFNNAETGKVFWGIIYSLIGLAIAWRGSYASFEKIMSLCVGFMFITVVFTAIMLKPNFIEIISGMFYPSIPSYINAEGSEQGVVWTLALMGGVGGTLTILSYGYWIREKGRKGKEFLKLSRIDLASAYIITAIFGMAMVIIASSIDLEKQSSSNLIITLANRLQSTTGTVGSYIFLVGAWAAIFSSLLGVWQSVPYLFADFWQIFRSENKTVVNKSVDVKDKPYRFYLISIAIIPALGLAYKFVFIQKIYAVMGSLVIPLIAASLLLLNRRKFVGDYSNRPLTNIVLILTICLFIYIGLPKIIGVL